MASTTHLTMLVCYKEQATIRSLGNGEITLWIEIKDASLQTIYPNQILNIFRTISLSSYHQKQHMSLTSMVHMLLYKQNHHNYDLLIYSQYHEYNQYKDDLDEL